MNKSWAPVSLMSFCNNYLQNAINYYLLTLLGSAVKSLTLDAQALNMNETKWPSASALLACCIVSYEFGKTTSSSSFSRIFFNSEKIFFMFFSALFILRLMSVFAFARAYSYFWAVRDIRLPGPYFYWLFLSFSYSFSLKSLSSSIAGLTSSSGNCAFSNRLAKLIVVPSNYMDFGGLCVISLLILVGLGCMTAPSLWLKRGNYLKDSKSLALATYISRVSNILNWRCFIAIIWSFDSFIWSMEIFLWPWISKPTFFYVFLAC